MISYKKNKILVINLNNQKNGVHMVLKRYNYSKQKNGVQVVLERYSYSA